MIRLVTTDILSALFFSSTFVLNRAMSLQGYQYVVLRCVPRVEREEFVRFHQELFDRMDKNHDGRLTPDEWLGRPPKPDDK